VRQQALGHGLVAQSQRALAPFTLFRPESLDELRQVLAEHPRATLVAGSTDVFARIREGLAPRVVVGLRRLPELRRVEQAAGELRLGATVTHHEGSTSPVVRGAIPALAAAWAAIATVRIRRSATLGGNLMAGQFRYELPVIFGALDAQMDFLDGGALEVRRLWDAGLAVPGCLVSVMVPTANLAWFGYDRTLRPLTTLAVAVRRAAGGLHVSATVGSELSRPLTLAIERPVTKLAALVGLGPEVAAGLPEEIADYSGSADYRRHVAGVQIDRLLTRAAGSAFDGDETGAAR